MSGAWDDILAELMEVHKASRRRLDMAQLRELKAQVVDILNTVKSLISENMDGKDNHNEREFQDSKTK